MSNRFLCPISFASKMWYWSPVIRKVECIKVEDIKIGLLWCFNFLPVNYYSISKQEGLKFGFNTKQFIKPKKHTNCTWVWVKFGSGFKSSTCYNHNKCMFTQQPVLSKPLNNYSSQKSQNWIKLKDKTYVHFYTNNTEICESKQSNPQTI